MGAKKEALAIFSKKEPKGLFRYVKISTKLRISRLNTTKFLDFFYRLCYTYASKIDVLYTCANLHEYITQIMSSSAAQRRIFSHNQPHIFHTLTVFRPGADDINSRRINTAVTENICELGNVFLDTVKHSCKQMPKIMREHLVRVDVRFHTEGFHIPPDVRPADRLSAARDKDIT